MSWTLNAHIMFDGNNSSSTEWETSITDHTGRQSSNNQNLNSL